MCICVNLLIVNFAYLFIVRKLITRN